MLEVVAVDGVVYAITVGDVFESTDGGATWVSSSVPSWDERLDHRYPETRTDCSELERCFEVVHPNDEPSVAISIDQITPDRRTILTVSPDQLQRLTNVALPQCGDESFDSLATVDLPDGNHVVLSMGDIGVLHHRPDRSWEWVAVGDFGLRSDQVAEEPFGFAAASTVTDDWWERWPVGLVLALLVLAPVAVGLAIVPIVRLARRNGRDSTVGIVTSVVVALLLAAAGAFVLVFALGFGERGQAAVGAAVIASVAVCTIVPLLGWYARSRGEGGSPPKEQLPPDQWRPPHPSGRAG